jgi:hypothetical protein
MRFAVGSGLFVAVAMGLPSVAQAQDKNYPTQEDRDLDRALRREYGDPNGPAPPQERPAPSQPIRIERHDDEDEFFFHLGVFGSYWAVWLRDASVASGRQGFHGDYVPLYGSDTSAADLSKGDPSHGMITRGWIDLGSWFSFDGGVNRASFHTENTNPRDFTFRAHQFNQGTDLETRFQFLTADLNFVVHPAHCAWGQLDLLVGGRYIWSKVEFKQGGGSFTPPILAGGGFGFGGFGVPFGPATDKVGQTVEGFVPTVGLGFKLRPVHTKEIAVEFAARGVVGGFDWEERRWHDRGDSFDNGFNDPNNFNRTSYYAYTANADGSLSLILWDTFGFTAGYHYDVNHISIENRDGSKRAEWKAHGPYGGIFVQF